MSLTTVVQWMSEQRQLGQAIALVLDSEDERETRQQLLRSCDYERYCGVYHQTPVSELADAGPFIFIIEPREYAVLDTLLAEPQRHWGWLASLPQQQLPALTRHWRERIITGTRPHQALYRFHDNRVLARALAFMPEDARPGYLGPVTSVCYWAQSRWDVTHNPAPGEHPVPDQPAWLNVPAPPLLAIDILHTNIYRYLWAERSDEMLTLSQHRAPDEWLAEQLTQARHWNWNTPEQLHFLVLHRLETLERPLIKNWSPRDHETPQAHFERLLSEVQFWAGETPL